MSDSRMLPMCGEGITKNMSHQLIIIGNGFDIECGLNSRFYQFFEPRMHVIETIDDLEDPGSVNALRELSITAWDVVIYVRRQLVNKGEGINWCDVEAVISDVIGMEGKASEDHRPGVPSLPDNERVTVASLMSFSNSWMRTTGSINPVNTIDRLTSVLMMRNMTKSSR